MNMISQKYVNLLKNCIKDKISSLSDEFINYLINNLFNTNENMYLDFISKTQEFSFEIIWIYVKFLDTIFCQNLPYLNLFQFPFDKHKYFYYSIVV